MIFREYYNSLEHMAEILMNKNYISTINNRRDLLIRIRRDFEKELSSIVNRKL